MPETQKCQFKSKIIEDYTCPEPALKNSEKGYCIFHEPSEDKNIKNFSEGIKRKIDKKDYDFRGYWFPEEETHLEEPAFEWRITFTNFTFETLALFAESIFKGYAYFSGATFEKGADFRDSTLEKRAVFPSSTFKERVYFGFIFDFGSTFKDMAIFNGAAFEKGADFARTTFEGVADFTGATFRDAVFTAATFEKAADFRNSSFVYADFAASTFKEIVRLDHVRFKIPSHADVLFRKAKVLWHEQGNYVEEGKCHYQEMDYIRKQKNWFVRYILANLFHRLLYGYGEKPFWIFAWCAGLIIFSSVIYWISKGVLKIVGVRAVPVEDYWNSLYFSVVTFTTLGYGDFRPIGKVKILASIEAILGIFFVALFIFTFARRTAGR
ncbi:hypothetical protein E3J84_00305 [Candidatus Aerophobetes bacterium]|uniref:Potassium channel domain-containing protein n=1 Tax=Aerophobetes bacterium TaxID=2030807 RepID=A0A523S5E3_UNCAE|nr:MAG: hypothetical protein E3J84_00305 [Candidatus Aerophobetes bacterium]